MSTICNTNETSHFITLQEILHQYDINTLTQTEINFLQLYYLEAFDMIQIAALLELDTDSIHTIAQKFIID